ncbi:DUF1320 domain-containing protein [Azospirillaceae bacterium]
MTVYATAADLIAALGAKTYERLTDPSYFSPDSPAFDRGADALQRASAEIDGYLCQQHALPLSPVPPMLRVVCCDIAYYRLHIEKPPEEVVTLYDRAVRWLQGVAAGKIGLGLEGNVKPAVETTRRLGSVALAI